MTIEKAELITVVNNTLNRGYTGTALDTKITATLKDLSMRGNFLQDEFKRETIADPITDYYSLPDNFKDLLFVGMKSHDDTIIYKPLVYERFEMYQRNIYYSSTPGTPTRYTWQSGYMYPRPIPDAIYNMYLWYSYLYPEKVINDEEEEVSACDYILFTDIYRKAIEMGLCYEVALGLNLDKDAQKFKALYFEQASIRKANLKEPIKIATYRDGF